MPTLQPDAVPLRPVPMVSAAAVIGRRKVWGVVCEADGTLTSLRDSFTAGAGTFFSGSTGAKTAGQRVAFFGGALRELQSGAAWPVFTGSFSLLVADEGV